MKTIVIRTKLDKAVGGGEFVEAQLNLGPLNLIKAKKIRQERADANRVGWGNIGCGRSFIEINGEHIPFDFLPNDMNEARLFLAQLANGGIAQWVRDANRAEEEFSQKLLETAMSEQ